MADPTTREMWSAVRLALAAFAAGDSIYSFNLGDLQITYNSTQKEWLQDREKELAKQLSIRNVRKRTFPDFSDEGDRY